MGDIGGGHIDHVVQITTWLWAQTLALFGRHVEVCPSPFGRGWRGAPGEGFAACWHSSGPLLEASPYRACASRGHLLPKGEGHALRFIANLDNNRFRRMLV